MVTIIRSIFLDEFVRYLIEDSFIRNPINKEWEGIRTISLHVHGRVVAVKVVGIRPTASRSDILNDMYKELLPRKVTPVLGPPPAVHIRSEDHG